MIIIKGKKILITGGAGFIGSNLAEELCNNNTVIIMDNLSTGKKRNIERLNVKFIKGSITDLNLLREICKKIDYVFHLAALPGVQRSIENPKLVHETNVTGTLNVLIAAKNSNIKKLVFSSSASVYGDTTIIPTTESVTPNPLSPYAITKLLGEHYCKVFYDLHNIPTVCVRYFNVYGPKQSPDDEYSAVIPKFISRVLQNKSPIIHGDGIQTRDFTYVKDVVDGTIMAAESEKTNGEVINIASGKRISIKELAEKIVSLVGNDVENLYVEPKKGDIKHSEADISKARILLGYRPTFTIEEGLLKVINYLKV